MVSTTTAHFLIVVIATCFQISEGFNLKRTDQSETGLQHLNYLGIYEGKEYYGAANKTNWFDAYLVCTEAGMKMVRYDSADEVIYLIGESGILENHGPFWLSARDLGSPEMYRWVEDGNDVWRPPRPHTTDPLDSFINFNYSVEEGPMALTANANYGTHVVGAYSNKLAAKPFCQRHI